MATEIENGDRPERDADAPVLTDRRRAGLAKLRGATATAEPLPEQAIGKADPGTSARSETATAMIEGSQPDVAAPTPETPEGSDATGVRRTEEARAPRRLVRAVVALAVVVALLLAGVLVWSDRLTGSASTAKAGAAAATADGGDRLAALQASRQFAVSFFTYDYRNLDAYFRRVESGSTGSFRSDFVSKEATLKQVVTKLKTVATGQVPDSGAGIFALSGDKAVAFVAANLNATNAVTKNGQKRYRIKLSLQKVKGAWLVSDFSEVL